jgi:redox-sensitive bicupin YhaK (pirin superfamily)
MTAGRGILHCEMPEGDEIGHGLQLWVNLSKQNKMVEPAYQELLDKDIPKTKQNGVSVKVIAGESLGIKVNINHIDSLWVGCLFSQLHKVSNC